MDRRNFLKNASVAGLFATMGPTWVSRALAAEPRGPMGRRLGPDETLLIYNANFVDVIGSRIFNHSALLIRGGKIEKMTNDSVVEADRKIDAGGRWVIPGIINAHCHMTAPGVVGLDIAMLRSMSPQIDRNCVDCVTHGVTTVRDQLGRQDSIRKRIDRIGRGELMGPRILRGIAIDAPGGYAGRFGSFLRGGAHTARNVSQIKDKVTKAVDFGADHIKLALQFNDLLGKGEPLAQITGEMRKAAVDRAAALGKTCCVHHTSREGFHQALNAGVQCLEHMSSVLHLTDEDIEQFMADGHAIIPTASVAWALAFPKAGDENFDHPKVQEMYEDKEQRIDDLLDEFALTPLARVGKKVYDDYSSPGYFDETRVIDPRAELFNGAGAVGGENMFRLYEAGARLGCGNDGGIPFAWPGAMALEMYLNQSLGMKPADVLRMATSANAEIIGLDDQLGTIGTGKVADLVLLDDDPIADMENMTKVAATLQSGRMAYSAGAVRET